MESNGTKEIVLSNGTVLPALIKCIKCRVFISQNWVFCPHCGKRNIEKNN